MRTGAVLFATLALCLAVSQAQAEYTLIHSFPDPAITTDGEFPTSTLVSDGSELYGTTLYGGANLYGTVFSMAADGTNYTILHNFPDPALLPLLDGMRPWSGLELSGNTLYGVAREGGANAGGILYSINTDGTGYTILHNFLDPTIVTGDGDEPWGSPIVVGTTIYGTTREGGANGEGVLYSINTDGTGYTILHNFDDPAITEGDGQEPIGALFSDGSRLYGTTGEGGSEYYGTVFSINPDGTNYTILHSFEGFLSLPPDGRFPVASLVSDGSKLFGTTYLGGKYIDNAIGYYLYLPGIYGLGTIFTMNPDGSDYSVVHNFGGIYRDGIMPSCELLLQDEKFYGVTAFSLATSANAAGTMFSIKPDGSEYTILHTFAPAITATAQTMGDGAVPFGSLISDGSKLYGTTAIAGPNSYGVAFSYDLPKLDVMVSSPAPKAGDTFTVDVKVQPIAQAFDAWGVIINQFGFIASFDMSNPSNVILGSRALAKGVPGLPSVYERRLFQGQVFLPGWYGTYDIIVGLVPAGTYPVGTQSAIPGYVETVRVTVEP